MAIDLDLRHIPDRIDPSVEVVRPNEPLIIYSGEFELQSAHHRTLVRGQIVFQWLPDIGARFSGVGIDDALFKSDDRFETVSIVIDGSTLGRSHLTQISFGDEWEISGRLIGAVVMGDRSVQVTKAVFSLPCLRSFDGTVVKKISGSNVQTSRSRLVLENSDFVITIDKTYDFETRLNLLRSEGGFHILYGGTVEKKKGSFNQSELHELITSFSHFLIFINGRRCCPVILKGTHDGETIWADYSGYTSDSFKTVPAWTSPINSSGISELWNAWSEIAKDELDFDFLKTVMHWYGEANSNTALVEGSVMLAQTALELIYNWWIVEKNGTLLGNDATNLSAANKIRLILNQLQGTRDIPTSLANLTSYQQGLTERIDGPESFVRIRNAIVHANEDKRKTLSKIPNLARYEALQLGLWYVELALLRILGFNGKYTNRCKGGGWVGQHEETVPWQTSTLT